MSSGRRVKTRFIIYKIWWPYNGYYYGKTKGFRKRRNRHLREMKDGTHHNYKLSNSFHRLGTPKIDIVAYCSTEQYMNEYERLLLKEHFGLKRCLNLAR